MRRNQLVVLAAALLSLAIAACSDVSAPRRDDPISGGCRSGYISSTGRCIDTLP